MTAVAGKYRARMWAAGLACLLSVLTVGCSEIHYFAGVTPVTAALETKLQPGKSTPAKVTAVLGKPTGRGGIMLPVLLMPMVLEYMSMGFRGTSYQRGMVIRRSNPIH